MFQTSMVLYRQVGRGGNSQSHERERRRVRHFRPRRDGDGARVGVAQDRKVAVAEEHLPRRRRRRRDARGPPAERARRAARRRPLEISEPRRRRLGVAGDDAVRRVDDARARRGPPAAAEGRVGERRVEVAVVAPPAFFFLNCGRASPARANFWLGSVNAYRRQRALESGMFAERPRVARRHFFHAETTSSPSCRRSAAGAAVVAGCPSDHLQDPRAPPRPRLPKNVRVLLDIAGRAKL